MFVIPTAHLQTINNTNYRLTQTKNVYLIRGKNRHNKIN